jgi:hypothetical protein
MSKLLEKNARANLIMETAALQSIIESTDELGSKVVIKTAVCEKNNQT